jgi:hypothetical protein
MRKEKTMLNKWNLKVAEFASEEESRYTCQAIKVERGATVATNGHYLAWISRPDVSEEGFPVVDGFSNNGSTADFESILLDADTAKDVAKALPKKTTIPVLANAPIHVKQTDAGAAPVLCVTDLQSPRIFQPKPIAGQFPRYENVFPTGEVKTRFAVSASYLAKIAKFAADFNGKPQSQKLLVTVYDDSTPVRFDVQRPDDAQGATFLLMPIRLDEADKNGAVPANCYGAKRKEAETAPAEVKMTTPYGKIEPPAETAAAD